MPNNDHVIPPTPLWFQLYNAKDFHSFTYRELANHTGVPYSRVHNVVLPRGRLIDFLKVVHTFDMRICITTWEGKLILPLEDSTDFDKLCRALTKYKDHCFGGGMHMRLWPSKRHLYSVECAFDDATLRALDRYLEHIHAHAVLVPAPGDEDACGRAAA